MARKLAHDEESTETDGGSDENDPPPEREAGAGMFDRRTYVRLGSAAVATILSLSGSVPTVGATESDGAEHRLRISGSGTASTYELTVDGELTPGENASRDAAARISDCTAEGAVTTGDRKYRFSGELRDLRVDGDAAVTLDGDSVR